MRGSNAKTHCGSCSEVLIGEAIKVAANLHYHVQCFLCTECGCELVNTGFFSKLAKYYCAEDYHSLFGTLCNLCHKYIEGEGLSIQGKGKSYHISCLTCTKCGDRFDEGSRITFEKDQALCDSCKVSSLKAPAVKHMCAACSEVIVGTSIFAMDMEWHMDCFTCQECKRPLTGEYMCKDGLPYCEEDYQNLYGQCCNICSDFILGKVLQAGGNSYHTACLKCYICTQQFEEGQEIFMQDELFWHTDCDETADSMAKEEKLPEQQQQPEQQLPAEEVPLKISTPEFILPPPSLTSPLLDSPEPPVPEENLFDSLDPRDRVNTDASYTSDYEELTVLTEENREVVYEADFGEVAPENTKTEEVSKETDEVSKETEVVSKEAEVEENDNMTEEVTFDIEVVPPATPEPPIEDEKPVDLVPVETAKQNGNISHKEEEGNSLTVKNVLRLAENNEEEAQAVEPQKTSRSLLSTASESVSERGSERSGVPSKPPRSRSASPVNSRNNPRRPSPPADVIKSEPVKVLEAMDVIPNAAIRGLRQVDSPVLKLLDDLENKDEQIDYLDFQDTYDLDVLQTEKVRLPKGIDRSQLQQYLTPDQFQSAFKMDQDKFDRLPLWKKNNMKKSLRLF